MIDSFSSGKKFDSDELFVVLKDPVLFSKAFLGIDLRSYQESIIRDCVSYDRVAVRMARQAGKSMVVAIFCVYWAFVNPGMKIGIVSRTMNQSRELFNKIRSLVKNSAFLYSRVSKDFSTYMEINGSSIRALTAGVEGKTIRGYSFDVVVLEECAYISEDIILEVVLPMIGASSNAKIIAISTPVGSGFFYRCFSPGSGYVTHHFSVYDCLRAGHFSKNFVDEMKRTLTVDKWKREYLAEFTASEGHPWPWELIESCVDKSGYEVPDEFFFLKDVTGPFYVGYDVGRFVNSAVFTVCRKYQGKFKLLFFKELVNSPYEEQWDYLNRLVRFLSPIQVTMDSTGMGAPIAERFESDRYLSRVRLQKITFSTQTKHSMGICFTKLLEDKFLLLPDDSRLLDQIMAQEFRSSGGYRVYSCPSGGHDDILWSLILCVFEPRYELSTAVFTR